MDVLQTERLTLRELVPTDAPALAAVLSDPDAMRHYPRPLSAAEVDAWIERARRGYAALGHGLWAVIQRSDGQLVGDCGLMLQPVEGQEVMEIGYHTVPAAQGHGYATEAAIACRDYAFSTLSAGYVCSIVAPENIPSRHVAAKVHQRLRPIFWERRQLQMLLYESDAPPRPGRGGAARLRGRIRSCQTFGQ